jgi:hypothetical protein
MPAPFVTVGTCQEVVQSPELLCGHQGQCMRNISCDEGETLIVDDRFAITVVEIGGNEVLLKIEDIEKEWSEVSEEDDQCAVINVLE